MTTTTEGLASASKSRATGRRLRHIRESLGAYLFILPAFIVIGTFGLFPMLFSVYVSLFRWRIIPGKYLGIDNYVGAIDNLAYVAGLWLAILFLYMVVKALIQVAKDAREHHDRPWALLLPALVGALGVGQLLRFAVALLPEVLAIAEKVKGQQRTQDLFVRLLGEAWNAPAVRSARQLTLLVVAIAVVLAYVFLRRVVRGARSGGYYSRFLLIFILLGAGGAVGWFTLDAIQAAYALAREAGEEIALWPQVLTISAGVIALIAMTQVARLLKFSGKASTLLVLGGLILAGALKLMISLGQANLVEILMILGGVVLMFFSWKVWNEAQHRQTSHGVVLWLLLALLMMIGAWVLISELPQAIQAGDEDWWQGLQITINYSLFTVPVQLAIAMFLAVLLFQNIKGKGFFRLVYFLPYITNPVAAAAVFRVLFSSRVTAPMNSVLTSFGMKPLLWLNEPRGIFQMLLGSSVELPQWLAGPSLALIVIVIYNIWSFVGYNTVVFLAGLGSISPELYEAASIDGAGRWQQFRHITLPMLSPTTYFLSLIAIIGTFKAFTHVWVLRSGAALGTTDTASIVIFNEFNRNTRYGYASALALVLMGFVLVLTLINNRIAEEKVFYG